MRALVPNLPTRTRIMSRKLLAFLLSELKTVRLVCQSAGCGVVTELSLTKLQAAECACPVCGYAFVGKKVEGENPLADLARAMLRCQGLKALVQVEFVLPDVE